jgi:hypothetical protein
MRFPRVHSRRARRPARLLPLAALLSLVLVSVQCGEDTPTETDPIPTKLGFRTQSGDVMAGDVITPAVQVAVEDDDGSTVASSTAGVTLVITPGTGAAGAMLGGTLTRAAVGGVATFDDLTVDEAGTGYTLTATAADLVSAISSAFDVAPVPTFVSLQSDPGDWIGAGGTYRYTRANAVITIDTSARMFHIQVAGDESWWAYVQVPDTLTRLTPGMYANVTRYPFNDPGEGGLMVWGESRACNTLTGWFAIDDVRYAGATLTAIDLRFEQHCEGQTPALHGTIHWYAGDPTEPPGPVNPIPLLWQPAVGATPATGNWVYLVSDAGDYIGQGQTLTYTPDNTTIDVAAESTHVSITVESWFGDFAAMAPLSAVARGYYPGLKRWPFHNPAKGGLSWAGQGRGCNALTGWFVIDQVTYSGDTLTGVDLRFEQHCEGDTPALRGAVHWRM